MLLTLWHTVVLPVLAAVAANPQFVPVAVAAFYFILAHFRGAKAAQFKTAVEFAFNAVEELKAKGALPAGADKAAAGLEQTEALLNRPLSDTEVTAAKVMFDALHAQSK